MKALFLDLIAMNWDDRIPFRDERSLTRHVGDEARLREINDWVRIDADGRTIFGLSQAEVG
ncbi:hypothetical protein [Burkholderia guangdongensis]|uniref:hypothetical protein n=1 Tax=Burkholderia guangdongensis TaxID=1792500 RepID=UPI001FEAD98D|nr:hypothetical protein [Burkholderia guangdongensis]